MMMNENKNIIKDKKEKRMMRMPMKKKSSRNMK